MQLLRPSSKALGLSTRISMRTDARGFLSLQYMIRNEDGQICFVEYFVSDIFKIKVLKQLIYTWSVNLNTKCENSKLLKMVFSRQHNRFKDLFQKMYFFALFAHFLISYQNEVKIMSLKKFLFFYLLPPPPFL